MEHASISTIFVRKDKKVYGVVTADEATDAAERGDKTLEEIVRTDFVKVDPDTPANDLFPLLATSPYPLAVVNDQEQLTGVIIKGSLLAKLSEKRIKEMEKE
jgi:glycine betaine/proline transport system ATP-binding protein